MKRVILSLVSGLLLFGCYDSMEILPTEELATSASSSATLHVSYELTSNAYFDGGEITVTSPIPNIVKDIILSSFGKYGQVVTTRMYVTTCHFSFGMRATNGYVDNNLVEQAKWDAECELQHRYGIGFVYCNVSGYDTGWNSGSGSSSNDSPAGGGAGGGSGSSSSEDSSTAPEPTPIINPEGIANETILNLYKKFYADSPTFRRILQDFCAENSIAHLNWETSFTLADNVYGELERGMNNYTLTILLNGNKFVDVPALIICKTMIHEAIHAKIIMDLLKVQKSPVGSTLSKKEFDDLSKALTEQNFPTLFDYYEIYGTHVNSQHEYMATYYVETIATALHEFSSISSTITQAIAWCGLKGTKAWEALPQAQRTQYNTIYMNYCKQTPKIQ